MTNLTVLTKTSAILSILAAVLICGSMLGLFFSFGYPKIISKDTLTILKKLHKSRKSTPYLYYLFGLGGFIIIFDAICISKIEEIHNEYLFSDFGKVSGIIYGVLLFVGIIRYTKLFPEIAAAYADSRISDKQAVILFDAFNKYIGESVTEHTAFVFLIGMIFCNSVSIILTKCTAGFIGYSGIIIAAGLLIGNLEFFGFKKVFVINRIFSSLSGIWLLLLGISLL
jgi:hypothetical protein